jgi:UDP-N-acetylmuramoyl-L-alanyl-D-glutamate--2,6-diaminopimelate ligase
MIGTTFLLQSPWYNTSFFIGMPGKFNIYNALCAICVAGTCGVSEEAVRNGLAAVRVPGRLQVVPHTGECTVLVDYAHNAASLENLLVTLREYCSGKLITVFGCGGDRAKSRRYEMGEVSGKLSDMTIITSDNPRSEDPMAIIADILTGFSKTTGAYQIEPDRTNAIALAISLAQKDDFVIIAGKGHENYQIFKDHTIHYDDAEIAENLLNNHAPKPDAKEMQ